jgi:hypothetical protein
MDEDHPGVWRDRGLGGVDKFEAVTGCGEMDHSEKAVGQRQQALQDAPFRFGEITSAQACLQKGSLKSSSMCYVNRYEMSSVEGDRSPHSAVTGRGLEHLQKDALSAPAVESRRNAAPVSDDVCPRLI